MVKTHRRFTLVLVGLTAIATRLPSLVLASNHTSLTSQVTSPQDLVILLGREEPPLGSRGNLCAISPGLLGNTDQIWSDRPSFIWQGPATQITVRDYENQTVIWTQPLTPSDRRMAYSGPVLQPGNVYEWQLTGEAGPGNRYTFQIMAPEQRQQIALDLQSMEDPLKVNTTSAEAIALQEASYFAQRDLWSDALQALYSVENPSPTLTQAIQEMSVYLCGDRPESL